MSPFIALASGGGVSPLVADLGLCLVAAAVLAIAFVELKIPAIAALLCAGVLLGPAGLEAVHDRASIDTIANLGLTLLLFVIGLEVNLKSLLASGRTLIVTGGLQVPLTLGAGLGVFLLIGTSGWALLNGFYPALYLGVACAFSSTLLVVKYLQEHLKLDTMAGRLAVGLLIFQDIWAIVFLALQPSFANPSIAPILATTRSRKRRVSATRAARVSSHRFGLARRHRAAPCRSAFSNLDRRHELSPSSVAERVCCTVTLRVLKCCATQTSTVPK